MNSECPDLDCQTEVFTTEEPEIRNRGTWQEYRIWRFTCPECARKWTYETDGS